MFPKPKRVKDRELLNTFHEKRCAACSRLGADPDHILTKGAGHGDTVDSVWPLCRICHTRKHAIGLNKFVARHPHLANVLTSKGFEFNEFRGKWIKPLRD